MQGTYTVETAGQLGPGPPFPGLTWDAAVARCECERAKPWREVVIRCEETGARIYRYQGAAALQGKGKR